MDLGGGVNRLLKERDLTDVYGTPGPVSSLKPVALPSAAKIPTTLKPSDDLDKLTCWLAAQGTDAL